MVRPSAGTGLMLMLMLMLMLVLVLVLRGMVCRRWTLPRLRPAGGIRIRANGGGRTSTQGSRAGQQRHGLAEAGGETRSPSGHGMRGAAGPSR